VTVEVPAEKAPEAEPPPKPESGGTPGTAEKPVDLKESGVR
jgi:hypothetical protein